MFSRKQNFKLSQNLKMGIQPPSSQGTFFKVSGVVFLLLSIFLVKNIYKSLNNVTEVRKIDSVTPEVLGVFDQNQQTSRKTIQATYTVSKGDTLFNIAQSQGINWVVIASLNDLKAPYTLKPGTVLKLR